MDDSKRDLTGSQPQAQVDAKAVQGMKAEDAVKWAETELKKIYEA